MTNEQMMALMQNPPDWKARALKAEAEVRRLREWRDTVRAFLAEEARCAALDGSETLRDCFLDAVERLPKF